MSKDLIFITHASHAGINNLQDENSNIIGLADKVADFEKNKNGIIFSARSIPSRETAIIFRDNANSISEHANPFIEDLDLGGFLWSKKMVEKVKNIDEAYDYAIFITHRPQIKSIAQVKDNTNAFILNEGFLDGLILEFPGEWKKISSRSVREANLKAVVSASGVAPC